MGSIQLQSLRTDHIQAMINRLAALDPGQQAVLADLLERVAPAEPGSERTPPMFFD